jgi:leucyl/phenylalanyl-tRNA--protein transferase
MPRAQNDRGVNKTITWLTPEGDREWFPPLEQALEEPDGLLAAGGDLAPARLLAAYRRGIFPWYSAGQPVLWWSPNPREVLLPAEFRRSRSLAKTLRNRGFEVTFDREFAGVMQACAARRENSAGTWITPEMQEAYCELHARGHAHSVEVRLNGALMGRVFFGESMFSRERDASKVAFARLVERAVVAGLQLIDCQLPTAHLRSLGSRPMQRVEFSRRVAEGTAGPDVPLFADA